MGTRTRSFEKAPAIAPLMLKAALPAIPIIGAMPGVKHAAGTVPDVVLERRGVRIDPGHLRRYADLCGFDTAGALPATYPHMAAFGLHMTLMTDTAFPFAPMGLVHLRNRIVQHRPLTSQDVFDVSVSAADLRPHPKGQLIDVISDVRVDDESVWHEVTTLFARRAGGRPETSAAPLDGVEAPFGPMQWRLPGNLGRQYAAVSGDRNPIHLYPVTARAFGFPSPIAHGMWTKARALAALTNRLPERFSVDVEFARPILLPGTVNFGFRSPAHHLIEFGVTSKNSSVTHMVGRVSPCA